MNTPMKLRSSSFLHKNSLSLLAAVFISLNLFGQNRLKRTDYDYDLISGKVNEVTYQAGKPDQFIQKYAYDADNRITEVRTSTDGVIWDKDAAYKYYQHGPLARVELGDSKVQGVDYAYNLQGWLKGVNSNALVPSKDIGKDGITSSKVARDVFGFSLGYFTNDYTPIGPAGTGDFLANTGTLDPANSSLFNGNIRHMATSITRPDGSLLPIQGNVYRYDQLNRLKVAQTYTLSTGTNTWASNTEKYKESFAYDANGNITSLQRNGTSPLLMDNLTYTYTVVDGHKVNNRLLNVTDGVAKAAYANDIDDQPGFIENDKSTWNYQYDAIGNLISDKQEEIAKIEWNVNGKVQSIHRTAGSTKPDLEFKYDAMGHRIAKIVKPWNQLNNPDGWTITYYSLDVQGNTLAVYELANNGSKDVMMLKEQYIYGSKRLGIINRNLDVSKPVLPMPVIQVYFTRTLGQKQFELSNHLGNVLATVSDNRTAHDDDHNNLIDYYTPKVISTTDYYAFGSPMPGRDYNSIDYRYGFNGKEKDNEVKGNGNSLDFGARMYDSRLGRWLSMDPLASKYSGWSAYNYTLNNPIYFVDPDGEDVLVHKNLTGSTKTVYDKMTSNTVINNILSRNLAVFLVPHELKNGKSTEEHLQISIGYLPSTAKEYGHYAHRSNFRTHDGDLYLFGSSIVMNASYFDPKRELSADEQLNFVATMIHESQHAKLQQMMTLYRKGEWGGTLEADQMLRYQRLYGDYEKMDNKGYQIPGGAEWSHELMAQLSMRYETIGAMKEYDRMNYSERELKKMGRNNSYYEAMSWDGLTHTRAFGKLSVRKQQNIRSTLYRQQQKLQKENKASKN